MARNPTAFPTPLNATCKLLLGDGTGYAIQASCTSTPPTTADVFQHGCLMYQTDTSTGTGAVYQNIGSTAVPSWSLLDTASSSFTLPVAATDAATTTGNSFALTQNAVTTGKAIVTTVNGLTTGKGIEVTHTTSVIANGGSLLNLSSTGIDTATTSGALINLTSTASTAGTQVLGTFSGLTTGTGVSLVTAALTTGTTISLAADALTTGSMLRAVSNSADTTARSLIFAHNDNAAAIAAVPVTARNDAVTGTGSKWVRAFSATDGTKTCTIWLGIDGTDPNGALTATAGDIMLNSVGGKIAYCSGTNVWVTITSA